MIVSFIAVLILELFEEAIEELIALGISWVITKAVSVFCIVGLTQGAKLLLKRAVKIITYKGGSDKVDKLKMFFKKLLTWFKTNPITIGASVANIANSSGFGAAVYGAFKYFDWVVPEWSLYLIIAVSSTLIACLTEWGIIKQGWETCDEKDARCKAAAEAKEAKRIEAEAKAQLEAEAREEAKLEAEARAQLEADAKAEADRIKAEAEARAKAEHEAKVKAKMAELRSK